VLRTCYKSIGPLISQFDGTLERFTGDKLLVVFNAPQPCADPVLRAVGMAIAMRQQLDQLSDAWRLSGYGLDFGIGVAHGDATLGLIDLDGRWDYTVIGSVRHLASRLSEEAVSGKILVSQSVWERRVKRISAGHAGKLVLNGYADPIRFLEVKSDRKYQL
jgi:class 3 adenylate cyclase